MYIKDICKKTKLTKKAVEYYVEQDLISPTEMDNGYRDFSNSDLAILKKIYVLKNLGLTIKEIKKFINNKINLKEIVAKNELKIKMDKERLALLNELSINNTSYDKLSEKLDILLKRQTIIERLLNTFPGNYGRFISIHFERFLNEPIITKEQEDAYLKIVEFLDSAAKFSFPTDLQEYLEQNTRHLTNGALKEAQSNMQHSINNMDEFLKENKDMLKAYLAYKKSDEYKSSPIFKIQEILKEFNSTSGYYDIFIPAIKQLSPSYASYYKQLELANDKLIEKYPEVKELK